MSARRSVAATASSIATMSHQQGADRHRILTQRGEGHTRSRRECFHDKSRHGSFHARAQRLAYSREPTPKDDDLRVKQVNYVRKPERQILGKLNQNPLGSVVFLLQSVSQVFGFCAFAKIRHPTEQAFWIASFQITDAGVDRPAGAAGFHYGPLSVKPDMTYLRFTRDRSVIYLAVHH
jgi:hypothetical protein